MRAIADDVSGRLAAAILGRGRKRG